MNYECLDLVIPYIPNDEMLFVGLVSREWHTITKKYITNYIEDKSYDKSYYKVMDYYTNYYKCDDSDEEESQEKTFKYKTSYNKLVTSNMLLFGMNRMRINPENQIFKEQVVKVGDLEVIKYMITRSSKRSCNLISLYAARYGFLEIMKWLMTHEFNFEYNIFNEALLYGNIDNLKWLREQSYSYDKDTYMIAQDRNNITIINWLNEIGCDLEYYNKTCHELNVYSRNYNLLGIMTGMANMSYST